MHTVGRDERNIMFFRVQALSRVISVYSPLAKGAVRRRYGSEIGPAS